MLKKLLIVICLVSACNVIFAGKIIVHRGRSRARIKQGIPNHNYEAKNRSRSVTAISKRGILLGKTVDETSRQLSRIAALTPEIKSRASTFKAFGQPVFELADRDNIPGLTQKLLRLQEKGPRAELIEEMKAQQEFLQTAGENLQADAKQKVENRIQEIATQLATSSSGEPNPSSASPADDPATEPKVKLYQWNQPSLTIDHCSISQFALQITETGDWTLSLKADQNRSTNSYNASQYIKRNEFEIRIRALGAIRTGFTRLADGAGRPVLAQWKPITFFVENGAPFYARWSGDGANGATAANTKDLVSNELLARFFDDTDRVEIEFFYR